jgi:Zn-dependent protease
MKVRITPGAVLLLAVMAYARSALLIATVLCVAVHECGHLLAARWMHIPLQLLELDLPGAKILPVGQLPSYRSEGVLAGAGPFFSLLLFLLCMPLGTPFFTKVAAISLCLGLFNLLPICDFDGGRMLHAALAGTLGDRSARLVLCTSSYLCLLLLFSLSACLLLRYGQNMTLAVLCATLFARLFLLEQR